MTAIAFRSMLTSVHRSSVTALALLYLIAAWAILTDAFEVVAAVDLRKLVEGERQLAWGNPPTVGGQSDRARDDVSALK